MKFLKTAFCIAFLLVATNIYANPENFRQTPDSLALDETPVYADVLKNAYSFLFFSPTCGEFSLPVLSFDTGWAYEGSDHFQKLKIFADDYLTQHYGRFIFEIGEKEDKQAFFVDFFEGNVKSITPQTDGYGPQDGDDFDWGEEITIRYLPDNNEKVPFARYGTSQMCYISLQDKLGDWYFVFLHSGILCY